jgi:hypothetical protein
MKTTIKFRPSVFLHTALLAVSALNAHAKVDPPPVTDTLPPNLQAELPITPDILTSAIALNGNYLATTCRYLSASSVDTNALCIYRRNTTGWAAQTKLLPKSSASTILGPPALNGSILTVPTINASSGNTSAVVIFERNLNRSWSRKATLFPGINESFGKKAALVNGNTIAILGNITTPTFAPVVFVYVRSLTETGSIVWTRQAVVNPPNLPETKSYTDMALAGETLVLTANSSLLNGGLAYVFKRTNATWSAQAVLEPVDTGATSYTFGSSVDISGNNIIIGAPKAYGLSKNGDLWCADDLCSFFITAKQNAGAAYVFHWTGKKWQQEAKLERNPGDANLNDYFGDFVSASGNSVAVLAPAWTLDRAGSAWIYSRSTTGQWSETSSVNPENTYMTLGGSLIAAGDNIAMSGNTYATIGYHGINASFLSKVNSEQRIFVFTK